MKIGNYKLETNKEIKLIIKEQESYLMKASIGGTETTFFNGPLKKSQIEIITIVDTNEVPEGVIGSWDVSELQDENIMAWYTDVDNNGLYELYIGEEDGVKANPNSSRLFAYFKNVKSMDLKNLDTSNVTNMSSMFDGCSSLTSLDVSSFNFNNVSNRSYFFRETKNLKTIYVKDTSSKNFINLRLSSDSITGVNVVIK